jgi:tRNA pseudouridine55 synthase
MGHSGTLDPMATGVLPVCLGKGTRLVEYIIELPKKYRASVTLGKTTDTEDATGTVTGEAPVPLLQKQEIEALLESFKGEIEQLPPLYSAVKYKGKPLYHWTRKGEETPRKIRKAHIYDIKLLDYSPDREPQLTFEVVCSRGTYIRTLATDLGQRVGCGAHLSALTRLAVGPYRLDEAFTIEQLTELAGQASADLFLQPLDSAVQQLPNVTLESTDIESLKCGRAVRALPEIESIIAEGETFRVYGHDSFFKALAHYTKTDQGSLIKTVKYFEG